MFGTVGTYPSSYRSLNSLEGALTRLSAVRDRCLLFLPHASTVACAIAHLGCVPMEGTLLPLVSRVGFWTSGWKSGSYSLGRKNEKIAFNAPIAAALWDRTKDNEPAKQSLMDAGRSAPTRRVCQRHMNSPQS
jgi:hypothetical protein